MIKIVDGDLMKAKEDIIGHQVNCKGAFNSGVAKCVREEFPNVFKSYQGLVDTYKGEKEELLGKVQIVYLHEDNYIANIFAQLEYGYDEKQYTDVDELERGLKALRNFAVNRGLSVALPYKIGSDRGGADWNEVKNIIERVFSDYEVTLYKL